MFKLRLFYDILANLPDKRPALIQCRSLLCALVLFTTHFTYFSLQPGRIIKATFLRRTLLRHTPKNNANDKSLHKRTDKVFTPGVPKIFFANSKENLADANALIDSQVTKLYIQPQSSSIGLNQSTDRYPESS